MDTALTHILRSLLAVIAGGTIGSGFGLIQEAARSRLAKRQEAGRLNSGWAAVPGSMGRIAYLLVALVAVQFVSPALFADGTQWWVSAGVAGGYGAMLFWQLRRERRSPDV